MKLILLFSVKNQTYTVIDHNLEDSVGHTHTNFLRKQGLPAFSHDQPTEHKGKAESCPECKQLIDATIAKGGMK